MSIMDPAFAKMLAGLWVLGCLLAVLLMIVWRK